MYTLEIINLKLKTLLYININKPVAEIFMLNEADLKKYFKILFFIFPLKFSKMCPKIYD